MINNKFGIDNDDYSYTMDLINYYINDKITFDEFLDVVPSTVNLKKIIEITKFGIQDKELSKSLTTKIINYYHSRLMETNYFQQNNFISKLLNIKEVFFLIDIDNLEKLVEGKEIDLSQIIREAVEPVRKDLLDFMHEKVLGNSRSKITMLIKPYNSLFNEDKYLKYNPGFIKEDGTVIYANHDMVRSVEMYLAENELFPARMPTEKHIHMLLKKQAEETIEKQ